MKLFVFVAAAAMTLASCQKNEVKPAAPQDVEYTFLLGSEDDVDSKATIGESNVVWETGDRLGTFTTSSTPSNNKYSIITPGEPASFSVYASGGLAVGNMLYFYYPYNEDAGTDKTAVTLSIPEEQDGKDDMPMASLPFEVTTKSTENQTPYAGQINLVNLAAIAEFNVFSSVEDYQSELVESVEFTVDGETALAGSFTFDLTTVDYSDKSTLVIKGYAEKSVVASITPATFGASSGDAAKVNMVVAPGTYTGTVVVKTDKASYTFSVTNAKEFVRSAVKPLAVDLAKGERVEKTVEPEPEGVVTATISFASDAQRVSQTEDEQVWTNDGVTFTNTKAQSTTDVSSNVEPVRLYKYSDIKIDVPGFITKIEFSSATGDYFGYLKNLLPNASVNGQIVTEVYDGSSSSVSYSLTTGQVRLNSITVTYSTEGYVAPTLESIEVSGDYKSKFTQGEDFSFGGVIITATYSDESTKKIAATDCAFSGYNKDVVGNQKVTVTYEGKTTTYDIEVVAAENGGDEGGEDESGWVSTSFADLEEGDQVVIVSTKGSSIYAMFNNNGTGSAPTAVAITYANDKLTTEPDENIIWYVGVNGDKRIFYSNSAKTRWMYCTNTNNGVRVGDNTNKTFALDTSSGYLKHDSTSRYLGVYNNEDWRCYTSVNNNITGQTFQFFVNKGGAGSESPEPTPKPVELVMSDISCSGKTENSLTFTWTAVENAVGYQVYLDGAAKGTVNALSYTAEGLEAGSSHTIAVKAVGNGTDYITSPTAKTCTASTEASSGGTTPEQPEASKTVTFDYKGVASNQSYTGETVGGVVLTGTSIATNKDGQLRVYASTGTFTLDAGSKKITKIELTFSGNYKGTFNVSGYSDGVWTGSESKVTFKNTGSQARITKIVVTVE